MTLLLVFALLAGAATAVSPCVLPVLPAVLSAGATGGRRRPVGIVLGLAVTFVISIVALASLVDGVGVSAGAARWAAVAVLVGMGVVLAVPALGDRAEARLSGLARLGPQGRGEGFGSGLLVGGALGFVFAPCAGPILAAVVSVSATRGASVQTVLLAIAYAAGAAGVLLGLAFGGRAVAARIRAAGRGPGLQRAAGVVLVLTGLAMAGNLDVRFQESIARHLPEALVTPTAGLERSGPVRDRLASLRGGSRAVARAAAAPSGASAGLRDLGAAPELGGTQQWFNTPGSRPLTLAGLRGRVVLLDFWTYTCINCIRTLPELRALDRRYRRAGLTVIGVHTPEFAFERDAGNVREAVAANRLRYPVVQDNRYAVWNAFGNAYWPAQFLLDARGHLRYVHVGEGGAGQTEAAVRALLRDAGARRLAAAGGIGAAGPAAAKATPESYLGTARAERFVPGPPRPGTRSYPGAGGRLPLGALALGGTWRIGPQQALAVRDARLDLHFAARDVYLVMGSRDGRARRVGVRLDGRPLPNRLAGPDVRGGTASVAGLRLYRLVHLPRPGTGQLALTLAPGTAAYAFTFG